MGGRRGERVAGGANAQVCGFLSVLLIPLLYVVTAVLLDLTLYAFAGWGMSFGYLFSFMIILLVAALVCIIPSRVAQVCIFGAILLFHAFLIISNLIGQVTLDELFTFEVLFGMRELLDGGDAATINVSVESAVVGVLFIFFLAISIATAVLFRKRKAGFRWRGVVASILIMVVVAGGFAGAMLGLPKHADNLVDNLSNKRFMLDQFNFNRHMYIQSFGPSMFYARNFFEIIGLGPSINKAGLYKGYEFDAGNPALEVPPLANGVEKLGADYNLIMLMLEAIELDAINPFLTPNLWYIKERSTWIDGYYSHERTFFAEYASLVGSPLSGVEMWSNFTNVYRPHALPQVFRRAGHQQIGAFHNFDKTFYRRSDMARPDRMGFDFMKDMGDFDEPFHSAFEMNSDSALFEAMTETIAPAGKTFFSWVLNVGTHTPHINSRAIYPKRNEAGQRVLDDKGRQVFTAIPAFQQALAEVYALEEFLERLYPRLANGSDRERRGVIAYLATIRDFDTGLGVLLEHLRTTPDSRDPSRMLIETTALVLYSDHYNYGTTLEPYNAGRGGLLQGRGYDNLIGERAVFMIYNPRDNTIRNVADAAPAPIINAFELEHRNNIGRRIERFAHTTDVYRTVAHLFNIRTSDRFTLGVSVLDPNSYSIGYGFATGWIFGICETSGEAFRTRDFRRFEGTVPSATTLSHFRPRLETTLATMLHLRPLYERNAFAVIPEARYIMS